MKKEDAKYILEAIEWMNEHTTVASVDMETYGNLFMNSQNLLMDVVNGANAITEPALPIQNVMPQSEQLKAFVFNFYEWHKKQNYLTVKQDDWREYIESL